MTSPDRSAYGPGVLRLLKPILLTGLICAAASGWGRAQDDMPQAPVTLPTEAEQAAAVETEEISIPTPGELFSALEKQAQPNWPAYYRTPIPTAFPSRVQIALALGTLFTDGYVAVEAMDGQQVKNVGRDLMALAKALGVGDDIIVRGTSLTEFAENNEWNLLMEELDATQNEVEQLMIKMRDQDLVVLVGLGGWMRGAEVVSAAILEDYTPEAARILRQPELAGFLRSRLDALSKRHQTDPLVGKLKESLLEIQELLTIPEEAEISEATVESLRDLAGAMTAAMSKKE